MKITNSFLSVLLVGIAGVLIIAYSASAKALSKISVDKNLTVTVYSTSENGDAEVVSPYLLEESVHVSELLHYPEDDGITMPFNFSDTAKWADLTEKYLNKRIIIAINGNVISTSVVKMKLNNGACSVLLNSKQMKEIFPDINFEKFVSDNN